MILYWDTPKKKMSTEKWRETYVADSAPPGVYVPNMSREDKLKWKAKKIGGKDPRVEIRKTGERGSQTLTVVRPNGELTMSMNGRSVIRWEEMKQAIEEALENL